MSSSQKKRVVRPKARKMTPITVRYPPTRLRMKYVEMYFKLLEEHLVTYVRTTQMLKQSGIAVENGHPFWDYGETVQTPIARINQVLNLSDLELAATRHYMWFPTSGLIEHKVSVKNAINFDRARDPALHSERMKPVAKWLKDSTALAAKGFPQLKHQAINEVKAMIECFVLGCAPRK